MTTNHSHDLTRSTLSILFTVMLIAACIWVLRPFLPALIWATMIVVATWSLLLGVEKRLKGRRKLAASIMTLGLVLLFIAPFFMALVTVVDNLELIVGWSKSLAQMSIPVPPPWIERIPVIGSRLTEGWSQLALASTDELSTRFAPYAAKVASWFVDKAGSIGMLMIHFLLTIVTAAILYVRGEEALALLNSFAHRMDDKHGVHVVGLAGQAIRAVAVGVIVTAIVQSLLAAIGLAVVGLPFVPLLAALVFIFSIMQIGPSPVLVPAVIWLYWQGQTGWGTALLVWTLLVCSLDNILRPILIRRGGNLPLLLILVGIIGGLVAFGVVGIFVGPVTLAVAYTLFNAWIAEAEPAT